MNLQLLFTYTRSSQPTFTVERRDSGYSTINIRNMDNWQFLEERGFFLLRYVWMLVEYPLHSLNDKCSWQAQVFEYLIFSWGCYLRRLWDFGEEWPCQRECSTDRWHWEFIALNSFLRLRLLPVCGWRCDVSATFSNRLLPCLPHNYVLFHWNNKFKFTLP